MVDPVVGLRIPNTREISVKNLRASSDVDSKGEVRRFLDSAGVSLRKFRYFETRGIEVLGNHLMTLLAYEGEDPIGYGHLDVGGDKLWLGICVAEGKVGRGLGRQIMDALVAGFHGQAEYAALHLSVDTDNPTAISLYEKYGFVREGGDETRHFMVLERVVGS